nr:BTAD domain-containing putative transcriptional regulator [Kribbella sandramycini]
MLAVLALSAGQVVPVETVVHRVWGENPPADPRASLYNLVRRLRQALGDDVLGTEPLGYRLLVEPAQVDALVFAEAAGAGDVARALALWGEPFAGETSDWLRHFEAPRLTEAYLAALEQRIDADLAAGKYVPMTIELADLVNRYPLRESLWARRLRALSGAGRQAEALELYGDVRSRIADELGVDPSAELQEIYRGLLTSEPQLPASTTPQQLPPDLPQFTGRTDVLETLDALADSGAPTVTVVLHGEGGVGKTSVAVRWAHGQSARFPDGRFFVRLRGYGPSEPVPPTAALEYLLRSLGITGAAVPDGLEDRSALLRTTLADRQVLLVLDDARDAEQVRPLLPATGAVVLITSRSQLSSLTVREGARPVRVGELSAAEARALLAAVLQDRRELPGDAELVELVTRCCHLPLALAIVGERLAREPELTVGDVLHQLGDETERLDVLDTGEDTATELRAVFACSYRVLDPEAARLFRLLGLHPGTTIGVPAAAALAGVAIPVARRLLDRLVTLHLLRRPDGTRFQLHDLLRAYAVEQSAGVDSEADRDAARDRLFSWYLFTAADARDALALGVGLDLGEPVPGITPLSFSSESEAMRWFDAEYAVLTAAAHRAAALGRHLTATRLVQTCRTYLAARFSDGENVRSAEFSLEQAERTDNVFLQAHAANQLGVALARSGELTRALPYFELTQQRFAAIGNRNGAFTALNNLGTLHKLLGNGDRALHYLHLALDEAWLSDRDEAQVFAETNLCSTYLELDRSAEALPHGRIAVESARKIGKAADLAVSLDGLGEALSRTGAHAEAIAILREALQLTIETETGITLAYVSLGKAYALAGEQSAAATAFQDALNTFDSKGFTGNVDRVSRDDIVKLLEAARET